MVSRKKLQRGPISLIESCYVITKSTIRFGEGGTRQHHGGSFRANVLGPIVSKPYEEGDQLTFEEKKNILGQNRFAVGGKTQGMDVDSQQPKRDPKDLEPM